MGSMAPSRLSYMIGCCLGSACLLFNLLGVAGIRHVSCMFMPRNDVLVVYRSGAKY
jgi:hypothetical protein